MAAAMADGGNATPESEVEVETCTNETIDSEKGV
jgi:hypothetical protein